MSLPQSGSSSNRPVVNVPIEVVGTRVRLLRKRSKKSKRPMEGSVLIAPYKRSNWKEVKKAGGRVRKFVETVVDHVPITRRPEDTVSKEHTHSPADDILHHNPIEQNSSMYAHKTRSQNHFMREWKDLHCVEVEQAMVELEAPRAGRECTCGATADWRCEDCFGRPELCRGCCREVHVLHPWHRVDKWDDRGYFKRSTIGATGLMVFTGHGGRVCPTVTMERDMAKEDDLWEDVDPGEDVQSDDDLRDDMHVHNQRPQDHAFIPEHTPDYSLVVVDVSGIHQVPVRFCICPNADPHWKQLLSLKLYPTSYRQPQTVFTFAVMEDFLLHNRVCKTAASNYYQLLRRRTRPAEPDKVIDRYRELLRVARQWRVLQRRLRSGMAHDNNRTAGRGAMALFCASCPQPGINLPETWKTDPDKWKYRHQYVMDGNFAAEHQKMSNPEDDVQISDGQGFFVGSDHYKEHLRMGQERYEASPSRSTCNNHRAVNAANNIRSSLQTTGIGATACARHGCFVPHTVVDFQKGERQLNMDYSFAQACSRMSPDVKEVVLMYDVVCQWHKHFPERVKRSATLQQLFANHPNLKIVKGIGIFHVHGHQQECFARYAPDFIQGIGQTEGEIIETLWAIINEVSRGCRGMTAAHRQEVLDDHMNDSNWMKMTRIAQRLRKKLVAAQEKRAENDDNFSKLIATLSLERRAEWEHMEVTALSNRIANPAAMDVYDVKLSKAPGRAQRQLALAEMEHPNNGIQRGTAHWIVEGMKLEEDQLSLAWQARELKQSPSVNARLEWIRKSQSLMTKVEHHETRSAEFLQPPNANDAAAPIALDASIHPFEQTSGEAWDNLDGDPVPLLANIQFDDDELPAYKVLVVLPSTIGAVELTRLGLDHLIRQELELREGAAEDHLSELRTLLAWKSAQFREGVRPADGYVPRGRAWSEIKTIANRVRAHCRIYEHNRKRMHALAPAGTALGDRLRSRFLKLTRQDLKISTEVLDHQTQGNRNTPQSWIWAMNVEQDITRDEWLAEYQRVVFLREKARRDRWREEVALLKSELQWTQSFFRHHVGLWHDRAQDAASPGYRAYAFRQAGIFETMEQGARRAAEGVDL